MADTEEIQQGWSVKLKGEKYKIFLVMEIESGTAELIYRKRNPWEKDESRFAPVADLTRVCTETVREPGRGGLMHDCGRPSKYPSGLCGVHGGAREREKAKKVERNATAAREAQKIQAARERLATLGVTGNVGTNFPMSGPNRFTTHFSGTVHVTLDELERALDAAYAAGRESAIARASA